MYKRVLTYEGEEYLSEQVPVWGNVLGDKFIKIASSIAQHVANVSYDKIRVSRMVLNLKIDKYDRIWFCWCSSIWVSGDRKNISNDPNMKMKPLSLNDNMVLPKEAVNSKVVANPQQINKIQEKYSKKLEDEEWAKHADDEEAETKSWIKKKMSKPGENLIIDQQTRCLSCWNKVDSDQMYEISYRMIIEDHQQRGLKGDKLTITTIQVPPWDPKRSEI